MSELKKDKGTNYVLIWKSKNGEKNDKDPLAVEQNNYPNKIANIYIVYDLDAWLKNPTKNFKFKNCLFCGNNIVKSSD